MTHVQDPSTGDTLRESGRLRRSLRTLGMTAALFVIMVTPPGAQAPSVRTDPVGAPMMAPVPVDLLVGRSTVLTTDRPIKRISLSTPDIADALVTAPREVLVHGKAPGAISLLIWTETGTITSHEVVVRRDLGGLEEHLARLFPAESISVAANGSNVVIAGTVATKYVVEKAAAVAAGYVENPEAVVNLLQQQEGVATDQVLLQVRFAEVSRTAVQELGASFFTDLLGSNDIVGRLTTQQFAAPALDSDEGLVFSDFLNVLAFHNGEHIGAVIRALETRGLFQSLAEPNLIAQNSTEAMFLAGGEYPYPVLQGVSGAVTVLFKEFGVRLRFTPTVVGPDAIHLKVAPEVSALDFSNAVTIDGFRVPALSTRRTETQVELRDGQTFAIAGLIDNTVTETMSKIPGLGDIPILGLLFKSRAYQKNQTELVVMITPHIVRRDSVGVASELPELAQPFLEPLTETFPSPPPSAWGGASSTSGTVGFETGVPTVAVAPEVAARERKAAERRRKEEEKAEREAAKRAEEEARRAARAERERLEEERKQAEQDRKAEEQAAREAAKQAAEEAKRAAKAERERLERERELAERRQKAEAAAAQVAAREAAEEAKRASKERRELEKRRIAEAVEAAKRYEREQQEAEKLRQRAENEDEKLGREQAERQAELDRIQAEYQARLDRARQAVTEIESERERLAATVPPPAEDRAEDPPRQ